MTTVDSGQVLPPRLIDRVIEEEGIDFEDLNIEELWGLISRIEASLDYSFVRMDFGVPGLSPPELGRRTQAEVLLESEVAGRYPPPAGDPEFRQAVASFLAGALGIRMDAGDVVATCGATQALFIAQAVAGRRDPRRGTVLFLEPGYPPSKAQARFLGLRYEGVDLDRYRGRELVEEIERRTAAGEIAALCWSAPNNPTWLYLTPAELEALGRICTRHDVVAIEDLAYLGVDPDPPSPVGPGPLQQSIARYTEKYLLVLSASKMLSYAGERVGAVIGSPELLNGSAPGLETHFGTASVRRATVSLVFNLTAGAPHSAQRAVAALLSAAHRGEYDLVGSLAEYRARARAVKEVLSTHGFELVYEPPAPGELGDGFYFTFCYPKLSGAELLRELLYFGIAALPLYAFGSRRTEGLRACVARVKPRDLENLSARLDSFVEARRRAA